MNTNYTTSNNGGTPMSEKINLENLKGIDIVNLIQEAETRGLTVTDIQLDTETLKTLEQDPIYAESVNLGNMYINEGYKLAYGVKITTNITKTPQITITYKQTSQ